MRLTAEKFEEAIELEKMYCTECDSLAEDISCKTCGEECITLNHAQGDGFIEVDDDDSEVGIISFGDDED